MEDLYLANGSCLHCFPYLATSKLHISARAFGRKPKIGMVAMILPPEISAWSAKLLNDEPAGSLEPSTL